MEFATLRNGVKIPMVGFGTYPLKGTELRDVLFMTYKAGYLLYDSAFLYKNEGDIGRCIKEGILNRDNVLLTSKLQGLQYVGRKRYFYLDRMSVKKAYKRSCKRFNTEYLDIYLLHSPFEGYVSAYKELLLLYKEGKVKAVGVSNFDEQQLEKLYNECGEYPMINQIELHPFNTMKSIVEYCKNHDIQVEAYSPFGRGNLVSEIMNNHRLKEIATIHNKSVGQIVLRWIVQQNIIVIPRSTNLERIKQNIDIFDFSLSDQEMQYIDSLNQNKGFGKHFQNKK